MNYLEAFNLAGSGAVRQSRRDIACAIRGARRLSRAEAIKVRGHAIWVGYPIRLRPNGSYR